MDTSGGSGGYDIGASLAAAATATSGSQVTHGNKQIGTSGGTPNWILPVIVAAAVIVAVVFLVRK